MNRRKYLALFGATGIGGAIAGCSGADDSEEVTDDGTDSTEDEDEGADREDDGEESESEDQQEEDHPEFEIHDIDSTDEAVELGKEIELSAIIANIGELDGETEVELRLNDETQETSSIDIDAGNEEKITFSVDTANLEPQEYEYSIATDEDTATSKVTVLQPATFEFESISPVGQERIISEEVVIEATVMNVGDVEGSDEIEVFLDDESLLTEELTLDPSESEHIEVTVDSYDHDHSEYPIRATSSGDEISGSFLATVPPVEEPDSVPEYEIENLDDISYNGVERRDLDVTIDEDDRFLHELSKEEVLDVCKDIILDLTSEEDLNAVSIHFWRGSQTIGAEMAFGNINWAPDGEWSEADTVETGDYTTHEFNVDGKEFVRLVEADAPDEVARGETFNVTFVLENMGLVEASISGIVEDSDDVVYNEFEIELDIGEQTTVETGEIEADFRTVNRYSLTPTGADQIDTNIGTSVWIED